MCPPLIIPGSHHTLIMLASHWSLGPRARLSLVGEVEASDAIGWRTMGGLGAHNGEAGHVTTWINEDVPAMRRKPTNGAKLGKFALALVSYTKHAIF